MTEQVRDRLNRDAVVDEKTCERIAQIVEPEVHQSGPLSDSGEVQEYKWLARHRVQKDKWVADHRAGCARQISGNSGSLRNLPC